MITFNGLVGIDSYLAPTVAFTSLSSLEAVLIHQFDDRHGVVQPPADRPTSPGQGFCYEGGVRMPGGTVLSPAYLWPASAKHADATAEAEALATLEQLPGQVLYNLACVYAICAAAVRDNKPVNPPMPDGERSKLMDGYAGRAMALLQRARQSGFFGRPSNLDSLRKDPDLDALRDREAFRRLLQELGRDDPSRATK
jgi:hypothetical protein